jgi:uncharacterized protein with gpF-like domain
VIAMALPVANFDELNRLVGFERSLSINRYFDEMHLTKQQKAYRKRLASQLYEEMVWLMSYMFYARQQGISVSMDAITEIRDRYREALGNTVAIDLYIATHIDSITADIVDATNRHRDDPYFYSKDRARLIAEGEANSIFNHTEYEEAAKNKKYKTWHTIMDNRERESHAEVNGTKIPIDDYFVLHGGTCLYPRSDELPTEEVANCRCSLTFS